MADDCQRSAPIVEPSAVVPSLPRPLRRLRQFLDLDGVRKRLLVESLVLMPLVRPWLRLVGFKRLRDRLQRRSLAAGRPSRADEDWARAASDMVDAAAAHGLKRGNCLDRSLLLAWLLARRGIAFELRIGVDREAVPFGAHAWVECGSSVLGNPSDVAQIYPPLEPSRSLVGSQR